MPAEHDLFRRFLVLGDGWSAGMGHFSLEGSFQEQSFPAQAARALGVPFEQPLFEAPGLGDVVGLPSQPPMVPGVRQNTVLRSLPAAPSLHNLSVPGFGFDDALDFRPRAPLVDRTSGRRTCAQFILGLPDLEWGADRGRTQLEYAISRRPSSALICLGFDTLFDGICRRDLESLMTASALGRRLRRLIRDLQTAGAGAVVVCTVPDPFDTAYFASPEAAARLLKTRPSFLADHWQVAQQDRVPLPTLYAMGYQTMARRVGPLPDEAFLLGGAFVDRARARLAAMNDRIRDMAERHGATVFDLHKVIGDVARHGVAVGGRRSGAEDLGTDYLGADYLAGLYLLNGAYPGPTLNAHIAAELLRHLCPHGAYSPIDLERVAASDANTLSGVAPGGVYDHELLRPRQGDEIPSIPQPPPGARETPIQTTYPELQPGKVGCVPAVGIPAAGLADPSYENPDFEPLQVPPEGLDYELELNPELSCFGDALRPVDCADEKPFIPGFPPFGLCEKTFFGGFLPTTSSLRGKIHVKIQPPDAAGRAPFEIRHPGGLEGGPGDLVGPQLFRMPVDHTQVRDLPGLVSSGVLDTRTGQVYNFHYNLQNTNTALSSLIRLNPSLPPQVQAALLTFPGAPNGGSTWAEFTPRPDGLFDVSLAAHMFVPLGAGSPDEPLRFALPFTTPDLKAAYFIARGTSLHPRIFVTTRPTPTPASRSVDLPSNTVLELTAHTRATYFGDSFDLNAPAFGGGAKGQSLLLARVRVQFGARTGDTVPVVFQLLPPGGLLGRAPAPPPFLPPGTSRGGSGFDTVMHFPELTYKQNGLASPDDPFNVCTTTFHVPSGRAVGPLLWRGFVVQALFKELIQVERCTPADSFNFQGPARFERGADGALFLRWNGDVFLPYPKGFKFPSPAPGGLPAIEIEGDSRLDPFRSVRASSLDLDRSARGVLEGRVDEARSPSTGRRFSYRWSFPRRGERWDCSLFEYVDHGLADAPRHAGFRLTCLSWIDMSRALGTPGDAAPDMVTFSGFGEWSLEPGRLHQVSAQISVSPEQPYVGIQIDGGLLSNVDVKPAHQQEA